MFFKKKQDNRVFSPIMGKFVKLQDVNDNTFSSGLMGTGFAVDPIESTVLSPFDGEVVMIFPTGHAIGLKRKDGLEVLIHIGIETVNLKGRGFNILVNNNDNVRKGQKLISFDKALLLHEKLDPTVIVIFTNGQEYDIAINNQATISNKDVIAYAEKKVHHIPHH